MWSSAARVGERESVYRGAAGVGGGGGGATGSLWLRP